MTDVAEPQLPLKLAHRAAQLVAELKMRAVMLVTAESCTGGLIAAAITEIPGASEILDRGFVTYSNAAKMEILGVEAGILAVHGAVSRTCAIAMAEGALQKAHAHVAVSVTGIAGPGGGSPGKPVGLVHFAVARSGGATVHRERYFGDLGRNLVRLDAACFAIDLILEALSLETPSLSHNPET
jgi:nicotinamide-nucleotide amidase